MFKMSCHHAHKLSMLALLVTLATTPIFAQYQQNSILSFEDTDGENLPTTLRHGHNSNPFTTSLIDYSVLDVESMFGEAGVPSVLGQYGLKFDPYEQEPHLSLVYDFFLNREKLTGTTAALFETDFYLPSGSNTHTVAILASNYDKEYGAAGQGYRFYRFGIQGDRVYFSFTNATATPVIYERQDMSEFALKKPGWHRLQMAIHADGNIFCYIDGMQTSFSPIQETTLVNIMPGIMVTKYKDSQGAILTDNLSVSWTTNHASPLPQCPWGEYTGGETSASISWDRAGIYWSTRMSEAWQEAKIHNKHILVFAHDNSLETTDAALKFMETPQAKGFMDYVVPLRLNIENPDTAVIANKLGMTEAPALMTLKPDGSPLSEVIKVEKFMVWEQLQKRLVQPR